jgi:hypothetical protein
MKPLHHPACSAWDEPAGILKQGRGFMNTFTVKSPDFDDRCGLQKMFIMVKKIFLFILLTVILH